MPISKQYKSIFIHIPKCAGTTVEKLLNMSTKECFYEKKVKSPQHYSWLQLKEKIQFDYSDYFKFSIIRHPYDRIISQYKWSIKIRNGPTFPAYLSDINLYIKNIENIMNLDSIDMHLHPQSFFLKDETGSICSDIEIFNFKNLEPLWNRIENITKIPRSIFPKSNNTDLLDIKISDITQPNVKLIKKIYQEDFDNFKFN